MRLSAVLEVRLSSASPSASRHHAAAAIPCAMCSCPANPCCCAAMGWIGGLSGAGKGYVSPALRHLPGRVEEHGVGQRQAGSGQGHAAQQDQVHDVVRHLGGHRRGRLHHGAGCRRGAAGRDGRRGTQSERHGDYLGECVGTQLQRGQVIRHQGLASEPLSDVSIVTSGGCRGHRNGLVMILSGMSANQGGLRLQLTAKCDAPCTTTHTNNGSRLEGPRCLHPLSLMHLLHELCRDIAAP